MSNSNQQVSAPCWPTGVPRADIEGLCKQLDYTFVDIPDLVDSDDDEVEMAEAPTNPQCEASSRFAPLQQPWPGTAVWPPTTATAASTVPAFAPQPQRSPAQAAGAAAPSSWAASHHGHFLNPGMVPPGFAPQPQQLGAAIPGPSSGAPTAAPPAQAAASYNANNAMSGPGSFVQQQQQQPLPGVAWGPEHLRRLQQQPLLVQPAAYRATQPAGRPGNSPAGS
ncbi:hypothetical protein CHLRE_08g382825v5 [Chlamydomonas reinhardtii]|uniref:Uncharacterized protein n=1 Tax=Chlamydomonas reinhardtii TaxID=3055 RepID=A0A2K3DI60_CHLRE|nr:uncharacterized protein CHLRE_08g382825v5 [Chlamydomonas reinhardtii]PNW80224.1 hypothetical protein CHLRE_08g382825v5 [Chlamydomonas reinhardtii]